MNNVWIKFAVSAGVSLLTTVSFAASQLSAKKDGVKVLAEPKGDAAVLKEMKKGDVLDGSERKGMYWEVSVDGKKGFVKVLDVGMKSETKSGLSNMLNAAVKEGREASEVKNSRSRSTVMGVRGLDDTNETAFAGNVKPNLSMVYSMEDLEIPQKRLNVHGDAIFGEIEKASEDIDSE